MPNWSDDEGRCIPCAQGDCVFHGAPKPRKQRRRARSVINMARTLASAPCSCYHINGYCSLDYDADGKVMMKGDLGTKIVCLRCTAREALSADGIKYTS